MKSTLGKDTTYHFTNILGVRKVVQVDGEASTNCVASNRYYNYDAKGRVISKRTGRTPPPALNTAPAATSRKSQKPPARHADL